MCSNEPLPVPQEAYEKMPLSIHSDHPLFNVGKKELTAALRTAVDHDWAADWLFRDSAHPFHPDSRPLPPEAFGRSLAVHIHHDISTSGACPNPQTSLLPLRHDASSRTDSRLIVSKDIDLLLVPIARAADVTAGYAFVRGVSESSFLSESASFTAPTAGAENAPPPAPSFVIARFVFHHPRNDFLMVVSGQMSPMIGIVSIRWITPDSRDRSYFAVPSADYGAGNLPSRVLSVQCDVDYKVAQPQPSQPDVTGSANSSGPIPGNSAPPAPPAQPMRTSDESPLSASARETEILPAGTEESTQSVPATLPVLQTSPADAGVPEEWFDLDAAIPASLPDGLESIGTVLHPEDPDALLPTFLQDFMSSSMDLELEKILSDTPGPEDLATATAPLADNSMDDVFNASSPSGSSDTAPSDGAAGSGAGSADGQTESSRGAASESEASWLVSSRATTPDGIGAARTPGATDSSAGAFDLSMLADSLSTIESSLSGSFFGPRVRKDVMDPQTGELISRCTGELSGFIRSVDNSIVHVLREIAAQSYYSSRLPIAPDNRMQVAAPPPVSSVPRRPRPPSLPLGPPPASAPGVAGGAPGVQPGVAFKPVRPQAPRLAPLAPRQAPLAAVRLAAAPLAAAPLAPLAPLGTADTAAQGAMEVDGPRRDRKQISREERLEAKRIKNRMSAAKSNQKRRQQLERQRVELESLRKRVGELQDRKKMMVEENELLKAQVALGSS